MTKDSFVKLDCEQLCERVNDLILYLFKRQLGLKLCFRGKFVDKLCSHFGEGEVLLTPTNLLEQALSFLGQGLGRFHPTDTLIYYDSESRS